MALTIEQLNQRLADTFNWAKEQLPEQARKNIVNKLMERRNMKNIILPFDKMPGFDLKGYVFDSTISNPPKMVTAEGKAFYPSDIKFTVSQDSYKNAAIMFYSTVKAWEIKNNKAANVNNLTEIFGNRLPVSVKPRTDREGNPAEGYWVNMSFSVVTDAKGDLKFQNLILGSEVEGKTINYENADQLLKPTDTQRAFVNIKPSLHITGKGIVACRCASLTLIPAPQREESMSVDDLLGLGDEPTVAAAPKAAPAQAPATPAPAPVEELQAIEDIIGMIEL